MEDKKTAAPTLEQLEERMKDLETAVKGHEILLEFISEFCKSVAHKDKRDLMSYQQLNSPSAESAEKVRMLFKQIREFGE